MKDLFSSLKSRILGGGGAFNVNSREKQIYKRGGIAI